MYFHPYYLCVNSILLNYCTILCRVSGNHMMISQVILDLKMDQKAKVDLLRENIFTIDLIFKRSH